MVTVVENGNSRTAGVLARNLDRVLNGLRTRVDQDGLLGEVAGGVLGEQLAEANVRLVTGDGEQRVGDAGCLSNRRVNDGVVYVPDRGDADTATHVDVLVAVNVYKNRALGV